MRSTLVAALLSCADAPLRARIRGFLRGLSRDEMLYIAEFLGSCMIESDRRFPYSRTQLAERIGDFQRTRMESAGCSPDQEHKMILLLEFLCRSSLQHFSLPLRSGQVAH